MIYLYAHTNLKEDLDSLRRVKAIYDALAKEGIECEILLNDYRAQLLAKEWGLPFATTIETIKDIDAVADIEDTIIIDSIEPLEGKVLNYPTHFKKVIYLNSLGKQREFEGAYTIDVTKDLIFTKVTSDKSKESIYIYGDSDYDKTIINNLDFFKDKNLDLYWGVYFFVKYEDKLLTTFKEIVEAEEYYTILKEYKKVYTSNAQVALEAMAAGIEVEIVDSFLKDGYKRENLSRIDKYKSEKLIININNRNGIDRLIYFINK